MTDHSPRPDRTFFEVPLAMGVILVAVLTALVSIETSAGGPAVTYAPLPPRPRPALPNGVLSVVGDRSGSGAHHVAAPRVNVRRAWVRPNLGPTLRCLADDDTVLAWGSRARLNAIDATTGALRWDLKISRVGPPDAPVFDGDHVLVGGMSAPLRSLDLHTGEERWRAHVPGVYDPLLVDDDNVWVGGEDFSILAISRADGHVAQRYDPAHFALYTGVVEAYPGRNAAGVLHDVLWTFDTRARLPVWQGSTTFEGSSAAVQILSHLADDQGRLYAMNALGDLVAFDDEGHTRWNARGQPDGVCRGLMYVGRAVVRVCDRLEAFDIETGALRYSIAGEPSGAIVDATIADDVVVALAKGGQLVFVQPDGTVERTPVTSNAEALCVAPERIYLVTERGALEAWM